MSEGFIRPEAKVLPKESLVPPESLIHPPPNRFTHETVGRTPFSYAGTRASESEDGSLAAGAKVVLLRSDDHERGERRGQQGTLRRRTSLSMLRPLSEPSP